MGTSPDADGARAHASLSGYKMAAGVWLAGAALIGGVALTTKPARAVPAFAQQTGQPCKSCHVGGFGPELTPFGREFKLGGYTLRAHASIPVAAMAIASFTRTKEDQDPAPEHLSKNDNLVLDQVSIFLAGGVGSHFGGFAQITYDGVGRQFAWDNLDLRAVTTAKVFGADSTFGLSLNNSPTVQDAWNTLPAWGFPFTDTAVSPTASAAPLIDGALAQNVLGVTGYAWIGHSLYLEAGGYSSPASGTLRFLGADPADPGSIDGVAPYARVAFQTNLGGGTFEAGAAALNAALFPGRDRSSGFSDSYRDFSLDTSWQRRFASNDTVSANLRYVHERGDLRASCALALIGDGTDFACGRYHLNEWRAAVRYNLRDKVGFTVSPFSITGSNNPNVFDNGSPDSNGLMGQVDYTFWPAGNGPLGPRFNLRVGAQFTAYRKFDGVRPGASANNALRIFGWVAF